MVRDKLIEFVRETARHITTTADVSPELQQLRYCLCAVARQCGIQLGEALPQAFPAQVRVLELHLWDWQPPSPSPTWKGAQLPCAGRKPAFLAPSSGAALP